ncbi:hypothetical protein M3J09_010805 [Ascochyta lentis]
MRHGYPPCGLRMKFHFAQPTAIFGEFRPLTQSSSQSLAKESIEETGSVSR